MSLAMCSACETNELGHLSASETGDVTNPPATRVRFDAELISVCGQGGPTPAGRAAFMRQPYIQYSAGGASIVWTSTAAGPEKVVITDHRGAIAATPETFVDQTAPITAGSQKVARVSGLRDDGVYCYEISGEAGTLQGKTGFRSRPLGAGLKVGFAALGDLGKRTRDQTAVYGQLQTVPVDFVVLAGDVAYEEGTPGQLEANLFGVYAGMMRSIPFFVAAGNHDYETDDGAPLRQAFVLPESGGPAANERWYSFDWGPMHVVVLDSEAVSDAQIAWLAGDLLRRRRRAWTIAVLHRPLYSAGHHGSSLAMRRAFQSLFEEHRVDVVIAGHDHHYERSRPINGVVYIVTGGGGRGTREVGKKAHTAFSVRVAHFTFITADDDNLRVHAIDATGTEFDSWAITRLNRRDEP